MAKTLDEAGVKRLIQEIKGANKNLNTPIPISRDNTPESKAQNMTNIADYVEKAKVAGIADVNGMAVTCLIDNDYSGVGYLYSYEGGPILVTGIITYDDTAASPTAFFVDNEGLYAERDVVIKESSNQVTSDMLVEGARKPIILTPETTEVDEETYQKLLSDDVDVVFKTNDGDANLCILTFKYDDGDVWSFTFTCFSREGESLSATYFYGYEVRITKIGNPHPCEVIDNSIESQFSQILRNEGFTNRSFLSPVLQEIDLRGTDADRKAKLDQFETDWKALTGAGDLSGVRFIGHYLNNGVMISGVFSYDGAAANYSALTPDENDKPYVISLELDGSLTITPLFSHLEAITIKTGNTPEDKAANVAAIKAYVDNLKALGVDVTKGYMIPVKLNNGYHGFIMGTGADGGHTGIIKRDTYNYGGGWIFINNIGTYQYLELLTTGSYDNLTTTAKTIVPAINEVNANAVHSDKLVPTLEAITIYTDNTPEHMQANLDNIAAYEANLQALGVDTTKGCTIPIVCSPLKYCGILFGRGDEYYEGVCNSHSTRVTLGVAINVDGSFYAANNINTISEYRELTTNVKKIIPAINEINALAKGYSTIFTPIELATETAQNKTAIDARVAAFTAQGISLTNGCCIPVTYKGVYAGNISLINGDWYGLLVKNTNNPADNINIKLSADGTITEGNSAQ